MIDTPFKSVPLKDVIYFQEGPGLRNWQYGSSGVPFLNIRTITDEGAIDKSLCQYVKQDEFEGKYEHFLLEEGDYVVSSSGTLGKLAEIRAQDRAGADHGEHDEAGAGGARPRGAAGSGATPSLAPVGEGVQPVGADRPCAGQPL